MKLQDEESKQRRKEFDKTLRLLLRYLPLTFLLSVMFIYILFQYTFYPEAIQNNQIIETHGKRLYAILIGFMVMSWSCIIYYFKSDGKFKNYGRLLIFLASLPVIYECVMYFDVVSFGLLFFGFYWLAFAFKPHEEIR